MTVLSFLVSFVFSLLVEAPSLGLEKLLLGGGSTRDKKAVHGTAGEEKGIEKESSQDEKAVQGIAGEEKDIESESTGDKKAVHDTAGEEKGIESESTRDNKAFQGTAGEGIDIESIYPGLESGSGCSSVERL